jgi:hypothetical protein
MKIAHLTSVHPVGDTRILHKEAASLAAAGHEVVLVAVAERNNTSHGVQVRAVPRPKSRLRRITRTAAQV